MSTLIQRVIAAQRKPNAVTEHKVVEKVEKAVEKVVDTVENAIVRRDVSRFSQLLLTMSIVSSFLYWTALVHPFSGYLHMSIKWFSIATLIMIVFRFLTCKQDLFLVTAMVFHSLGDLFLAHPYSDWLLYSLGPFLLGHVFYIMTFKSDLPEYQKLKATLSLAKKALITASVIYMVVMGSILIPALMHTPIAIPIALYMVIVSLMVVLSVLPQYKSPLMTVGCWMYIVSDSLIAIDRFYAPLPYPLTYLSWPLYYVGQVLISLGLLREKGRSADCFFISHRLLSF
jgi:uncharacterized membrane protein YhhN